MKYPKHIVAAGTLVQNKKNQILLVKTECRGWELPGGQVEEGEDIISALKREVEEESGASIEIKKMAAIYSSISEPSKVILDFISVCNNDDIKIKATEEILDAKWFLPEEVILNIQSEPMKYRVQWLLDNRNKIRHASYAKNPFKVLSEVLFTEKKA